MPSTITRRRRSAISPADERRFLSLLFVGVGLPLGLLTAFVTADTRVDLSDLHFVESNSAGIHIVGWPDLSMEKASGRQPEVGAIVCLYGYMMEPHEPDSKVTRISSFTLMPDAGLIIHPAHRHPDQMISVQLQPTSAFSFLNRSLVVVQGRFGKTNPLSESEPMYSLSDATVSAASLATLRSSSANSKYN